MSLLREKAQVHISYKLSSDHGERRLLAYAVTLNLKLYKKSICLLQQHIFRKLQACFDHHIFFSKCISPLNCFQNNINCEV